jgi:hypothetical protein
MRDNRISMSVTCRDTSLPPAIGCGAIDIGATLGTATAAVAGAVEGAVGTLGAAEGVASVLAGAGEIGTASASGANGGAVISGVVAPPDAVVLPGDCGERHVSPLAAAGPLTDGLVGAESASGLIATLSLVADAEIIAGSDSSLEEDSEIEPRRSTLAA